MMQGQENIKKL